MEDSCKGHLCLYYDLSSHWHLPYFSRASEIRRFRSMVGSLRGYHSSKTFYAADADNVLVAAYQNCDLEGN